MALFKKTLVQYWNILDEAWRFAILTFLAVRLFYALWSLLILSIQPVAVQNVYFAGENLLTVFDLENSQSYTYRRELAGQTLLFHAADAHRLTDLETGSVWDISTGMAIHGQYEGLSLAPSKTSPSEIFPYYHADPYPLKWLAIWQRFDANWYLSIAEHGYGGIPGDIHFPPLFPSLIRILTPLFGSAFLAGLFLAHLASLLAIRLLYETFHEWGGQVAALQTTFLLLLYPTSFFLFSVYTESLFLVTALLSLRQMRKHSWGWAGFWAFCAILTRLQGVALIIPMIYLMWRERLFFRIQNQGFGLALSALGGCVYLFVRTLYETDHILPLVESNLHARLGSPWESYWYAIETLFSGQISFIDLLNFLIVSLFIILLFRGWKRIPLEYSLYAIGSLLLMLIRIVETQPLNSMLRYSLMLFPCFFVLDQAGENPWTRRLIIYTFMPLNLYLSAQFFLWGWVA
jgi:hypothetical protein